MSSNPPDHSAEYNDGSEDDGDSENEKDKDEDDNNLRRASAPSNLVPLD